MKVLSIIPGPDSGTNMVFARRQIASLRKYGIEIETYHIKSRTFLPSLVKTIFEIKKKIWSFKPDLIHANYGTMTAFLAAFTNCRPLVITFHGSDVNKTPSDGIIRDFLGRVLSNVAALRATNLICVSRNVKNNLWWKQDIVKIIPCGINIDEFNVMDKKLARRELGWEDSELVVLFNANNPKVKRLDIAEKTIKIVKYSWPNARLHILRNVDPHLIPFYINASDCLLICSDSEGNPMIVREALACNLPIVGVDVGDIAEVLKDIKCTYIVEKEPNSLAMAIAEVFVCRVCSDGRKQLIEKKLTEKDIAEEIYTTYKRILKTDI